MIVANGAMYYVARKLYYKMQQLFCITKCNGSYYKVRQLFCYQVRHVLLQSATDISKCDMFVTKCDRHYKVRQLLQSARVQVSLFNACDTYPQISYRTIPQLELGISNNRYIKSVYFSITPSN